MSDWGKEIKNDWGDEGSDSQFQPQYRAPEPNNGLFQDGMNAMMYGIGDETSETPDKIEIKRATEEDLPKVWGIIDKCAKWLAEKGYRHWADHYTEEMMGKMIRKQETFLGYKNGEAIATLTFDAKPPKYYVTDDYLKFFTDPEEPSGYIMAVGVLPEYQGQGIAVQMLQYAEDEAYLRRLKWLRLDARTEVPGLIKFYENRGFQKVGNPLNEGENESYQLMEKRLN